MMLQMMLCVTLRTTPCMMLRMMLRVTVPLARDWMRRWMGPRARGCVGVSAAVAGACINSVKPRQVTSDQKHRSRSPSSKGIKMERLQEE